VLEKKDQKVEKKILKMIWVKPINPPLSKKITKSNKNKII